MSMITGTHPSRALRDLFPFGNGSALDCFDMYSQAYSGECISQAEPNSLCANALKLQRNSKPSREENSRVE